MDATGNRLLSRPCLVYFFAWARMESNSTIILTIISVIKVLKEILVYISRRLRKFPIHSKSSRRAS